MMPVQMKMARAAVGWGVRELADAAGVTANTVTRIENGADAKQSTIKALQEALEAKGIEFIPENGGGAGVRLKKGTATNAQLDVHIENLKAKLPHVDEAAPPSPAKGMKQLERAHGKNEIEKARGKRAWKEK